MGKDARIIEVRRTCLTDPEHPHSQFYDASEANAPIGDMVRAMARELKPEARRLKTWCIQVIHRPNGIPATAR